MSRPALNRPMVPLRASPNEKGCLWRARFCATLLVLSPLIVSCDKIPGTQANLEAQVHEALAGALVDPASAQLRNVRVAELMDTICGEVNSKNRMGGYVGYRRFVYIPLTQEILIEETDPTDPASTMSWDRSFKSLCADRPT